MRAAQRHARATTSTRARLPGALVELGFASATATQAVERATADVGTAVELSELIKQALRWCA